MDRIDQLLMMTTDYETGLPALTTLLYEVCDNNPAKFDEACRLIRLLCCRCEMTDMNNPNWEDAPYWANSLAMDADGSWHWYVDTISNLKQDGRQWCTDERYERAVVREVEQNWRQTYEERP